jgi:pimeloyl-ACP methyl ester carboxylesterase
VAVDLRGAGTTDKPAGPYSTEQSADDVAGLMDVLNIDRAHVVGVSFGAAAGMWLAAKYPERVASLSLHSAWAKTDPFMAVVVKGWQLMARALGSMPDTVIQGIFPWCFTPEMYAEKPEFVVALEDFVRSRPPQPVDAFLQQSEAVLAHDVEAQLGRIVAPTQITYGRRDVITSIRFAPALTEAIKGAELLVFEHLSHAGLHEDAEQFNRATLEFLTSQKL